MYKAKVLNHVRDLATGSLTKHEDYCQALMKCRLIMQTLDLTIYGSEHQKLAALQGLDDNPAQRVKIEHNMYAYDHHIDNGYIIRVIRSFRSGYPEYTLISANA